MRARSAITLGRTWMAGIIGRPEVMIEPALVLMRLERRGMFGYREMRVAPDMLFKALVEIVVGTADVFDLHHALWTHPAERIGTGRNKPEKRIDVFAGERKRSPF